MDIGYKLRNLRRIKNLTQEELAERTDLSKGYISQIESNHASPSMETFLNLIEVLGTSASDFFKEPSDEKVLYKKKEQTIYDEYDKGYILNWLVANSNEFDMEPLILTLRPNASYKNFKPSESDTFIYCLNGEVSLQLGNQVYKACKEDVLYFKAKDKHRLYNRCHSFIFIGGNCMNPLLSFKDVSKGFEDVQILNEINIDIEPSYFYTLLGPSGCGKTTILKLIAGFEYPDSGDIIYKDKPIGKMPPNKRKVNTVFQDYALFPHLNVFDNIAYGLKLKKLSKSEIKRKVTEALQLVKLSGYEHRQIQGMSGGQKQRVAIARAIVNEPEILLLDESLSALDLKLRTEMQYLLRELQSRLGITFIFVTHDQEEALALSDYIFVMKDGKIQQFGTPIDIYDEPVNRFVADFIGESNIVHGTMVEDFVVNIYGQNFDCVDMGIKENKKVEVVIRPEDISLVSQNDGLFKAKVDSMLFRGVHYEICCKDRKGYEWVIQSTKKANVGSEVGLYFEPEAIHIMVPGETEEEFDKRIESYEDYHHA